MHLIKKAGFAHKAVHMLFLDGVYIERPDGSTRLCWAEMLRSNDR